MKIYHIIQKNVKILLRSRMALLLIVLCPLAVMLIVGFSFDTGQRFSLTIGYYVPDNVPLVENIVDALMQKEYKLVEFTSKEQCIEGIKGGKIHTCLLFPEEFKIENGRTNLIRFYVDQSKVNLVYVILNVLSKSLQNQSSQISFDLTTNLLNTLAATKEDISLVKNDTNSLVPLLEDVQDKDERALALIGDLNLTFPEGMSTDAALKTAKVIDDYFQDVRLRAEQAVNKGRAVIKDLEEYGSLDGNQTEIMDKAEAELNRISVNIEDASLNAEKQHQRLIKALDDLAAVMSEMQARLKSAQETLAIDAAGQLHAIQAQAISLKQELDQLDTKFAAMILSIESVPVTNADNIVSPITTKIYTVTQERSTLNFLFPTLVILLIMFLGMLLPALFIIMEKNGLAAFRVFTTPTRKVTFSIGTFLTGIILISVQLIIILALSKFYFHIPFPAQIGVLFLVLFMIGAFFILLGMLLGEVFNTTEIATIAGVAIGSLLLLTSGLIFPIESMPPAIIEKARYNPLVISVNLFKKTMLFDMSMKDLQADIRLFAMYLLVLILVNLVMLKASSMRFHLGNETT